jgi:hypothetical protein
MTTHRRNQFYSCTKDYSPYSPSDLRPLQDDSITSTNNYKIKDTTTAVNFPSTSKLQDSTVNSTTPSTKPKQQKIIVITRHSYYERIVKA